MNTPNTWSLRDYCLAIDRYKWPAMGFFATTVILAAAWLAVSPRQYESNSKLFVRVGRENASLDPTVGQGKTISLAGSREVEMNSIVQHLRSRTILERVLTAIEPDTVHASLAEKEKALARLQKAIFVTSPHMSTVVNIQGTAETATQAQRIVATLVDVYLDEHMRICRASGAYDFFIEQTSLVKGELESADAQLRDAKIQAGMASIEGRRTALENQVSTLETKIQQVSAARSASEAKIEALKSAVESVPEPLLGKMVQGTPNDGLATMRQQLFQLRVREQELLSKFTPAHPLAIAIHKQVQEVEQALKHNQPTRGQIVSALCAQEVAHGASLAEEERELRARRAELDGKLAKLAEDEIVIEELTRNVRQLEAKYTAYLGNMEEARIDQALKTDRISNVSIIQPATFEPLPVRPRTAMILTLALLGGSIGGVLMALFLAHLNPNSDSHEASAHVRTRDRSQRRSSRPLPQWTTTGGNGNRSRQHSQPPG